jgi:hypothetical protein
MSPVNAPNRRTPAAAALFAALALTGCAAESGELDSPSEPDSGTSAGGSAEATTEPEPTEEPPPSAADGTDYSNCGTRCEVEVTAGVVFEFDDFTLTVTDVTEDGIELETDDGAGSTGTAGLSGGYCVSYLTANSTSSSCYGGFEGEPPEPEPAAGELAFELLHVSDGTAIIRLTMGD